MHEEDEDEILVVESPIDIMVSTDKVVEASSKTMQDAESKSLLASTYGCDNRAQLSGTNNVDDQLQVSHGNKIGRPISSGGNSMGATSSQKLRQ